MTIDKLYSDVFFSHFYKGRWISSMSEIRSSNVFLFKVTAFLCSYRAGSVKNMH